jgi:stage III sporulation protein AA
MNCAWKELLSILPLRIRREVDRLGRETAQEIRLREGKPPVLIQSGTGRCLGDPITGDDLHFVVNTACRYSPWTAATAASGYITAPGGHRVGLCGEVTVAGGDMTGFRNIRSVNIRIARDFPGIAEKLPDNGGNLLLLGPPGSGKTTLLRDLIRQRSRRENVAVVDERGELFPIGLDTGTAVDILTGCSKPRGIDAVLRTMGPDTIAVDEITAAADCDALLQAGWCGVRLLATVHGTDRRDLMSRRIYRPIVDSGLFDTLVILGRDKSFRTERMNK